MNVLDKIEKLRLDRGWSVYRLAEKAGITDKCIYNWYNRNTMPSILDRMAKGKAPLDTYGKSLQLHHIDGISNSSNIIPLDQATHTAFHRAKGYVGFTAQDLYDFLKSIDWLF